MKALAATRSLLCGLLRGFFSGGFRGRLLPKLVRIE
jgi:hypothetical protein